MFSTKSTATTTKDTGTKKSKTAHIKDKTKVRKLAREEKQENKPKIFDKSKWEEQQNNKLSFKQRRQQAEIAQILFVQGDYQGALDLTSKLIISNHHVDDYLFRSTIYAKLNKFEEAIHDSVEVVKAIDDCGYQKKEKSNFYMNISSCYLRGRNDLENSLLFIKKALKLWPTNPKAWYWSGRIYCAKNNFQQAVEDYTRVTELDPNYFGIYAQRLECYISLNRVDEARTDFAKIPLHDELYAKMQKKMYQFLASKETKKTTLDNPEEKKCEIEQAKIEKQEKGTKEDHADKKAPNFLQQESKLSRVERLKRSAFAQELFSQQHFQSALESFTALIGFNQHPDDYIFRTMIYTIQEEYEKAIEDGKTALSFKKEWTLPKCNQVGFYTSLGYSYYMQKDEVTATLHLEKAIRLSPEQSSGAHFHLGTIYRGQGDYAKAIVYCTKAISGQRNYHEVYVCRGNVYLALGKNKAALADFVMAIKIRPDDKESLNKINVIKVLLEKEVAENDLKNSQPILEITEKKQEANEQKGNPKEEKSGDAKEIKDQTHKGGSLGKKVKAINDEKENTPYVTPSIPVTINTIEKHIRDLDIQIDEINKNKNSLLPPLYDRVRPILIEAELLKNTVLKYLNEEKDQKIGDVEKYRIRLADMLVKVSTLNETIKKFKLNKQYQSSVDKQLTLSSSASSSALSKNISSASCFFTNLARQRKHKNKTVRSNKSPRTRTSHQTQAHPSDAKVQDFTASQGSVTSSATTTKEALLSSSASSTSSFTGAGITQNSTSPFSVFNEQKTIPLLRASNASYSSNSSNANSRAVNCGKIEGSEGDDILAIPSYDEFSLSYGYS